MKVSPLIAITPRYDIATASWIVPTDYTQHLKPHQATVIVIDPCCTPGHVETILDLVDGVLLAGGTDINPQYYGEQPLAVCGTSLTPRDAIELDIARGVMRRNLPCLGICRGNQLLNVAAGGTLYQDLHSQVSWQISHTPDNIGWTNPAHTVRVTPNTKLAAILPDQSFQVNSYHHQAVKDLAPGFITAAVAPDGVCEAIEHTALDFCLGIQWHPERNPLNAPVSKAIFKAFVEACRQR